MIATRGDNHLGGTDIDDILVKHCIDDFLDTYGIDLTGNKRAIARLRNQCIKAKHQLSTQHESHIDCESLAEDNDLQVRLTRAKFEQLCQSIFRRVKPPMLEVLTDAEMTK